MSTLHIRPFQPSDQAAARAIVLAGLAARWGQLDLTLNPDLNNIQASYLSRGHQFFVAEVENVMVATCALTHEAVGVARIERMSVLAEWQGNGFGRNLTEFLISTAGTTGYHTLLAETETIWTSALALYQRCGFQISHVEGTETHMTLKL